MEVILYINEYGTRVDECDFREIDVCDEDVKILLEIVKRSLENNNTFSKVSVLSEHKHEELMKFRDNHPDYIKYIEAKEIVNKFEGKYGCQ